MRILIGSQAAKFWFPDFREPNDIDLVSYWCPNIGVPLTIECYNPTPAFEWLGKQDNLLSWKFESANFIPTPDALYTIKLSHSFWDINWEKTMHDIEFFQKKGCKVIEEFFQLLYKDWESIHGPKKVNMNQTNEEFFNKHVDRKFNHDYLHELMAYYDTPMHDKLKVDKTKVMLDKNLFNALPHGDKIKTCREEIYVIALERFLIPENFKMNTQIAYRRAVKTVVTSLSKGWFPRFIVEHWSELKNPDNHNKFLNFIKENAHA